MKRLRGDTRLPELLDYATRSCDLGRCLSYSVFAVGYEDCNIDVLADGGRVVVKVFGAHRSAGVGERTVSVIERVTAAGVAHPRLRTDDVGRALHVDPVSGHEFIVMDHVSGQNFYELGRPPDRVELRLIVEQAALIHSIDHAPPPVFDPWAIPNLGPLVRQVAGHVDPADLALVRRAVQAMERVDVTSLPRTLIHGDMTKGNLIRTDEGKIAVLDFSVANWHPRIQELAVEAANLLHGDGMPLLQRARLLVDLYQEHHALSPTERQAMDAYAFAAAAMEFLGATYERHVLGNTGAENDLVLELGRAGLHSIEAGSRRSRKATSD